jgi:hypothetical protein
MVLGKSLSFVTRKEDTMLQVQVDYWKLQESKRHNLAEEAIAREQNRIGWSNASANLYSASANLQNAATNVSNAESNRITALANKKNADTNVRNAEINQQNADTNRINASANLQNAESNRMNAETNRADLANKQLQAQASWKQAQTSASLATYQTSGLGSDLDRSKRDLNYANANVAKEEQKVKRAQQTQIAADTVLKQEQAVEARAGAALKYSESMTEDELRKAKKLELLTRSVQQGGQILYGRGGLNSVWMSALE